MRWYDVFVKGIHADRVVKHSVKASSEAEAKEREERAGYEVVEVRFAS